MQDKQTILIADDSPVNRQILSELLGEDQYTFLFAADGVEALELLQKRFDIDLLLLDIHMPRLDGFGVLEAMAGYGWSQTLPVIIISSEDDASFIQRAYDLGATDYISRPFNLTVVQRRVRNTLNLYARQRSLAALAEEQVYEREKTNSVIISILSHVVESQNQESGAHVLHVRVITDLLLRQLVKMTDKYPLSMADISMIATLSALHDIGKVHIPGAILNKPGRLTPAEFEIIKEHTVIGAALLRDMPIRPDDPLMKTAHDICRWHHERWDGRGYPDGLKGDDIPIAAQVVAMADVYDALTGERCYKKALPHKTAMKMILGGECGAFNPLLLACLQAVEEPLRQCMQQEPGQFDYQLESQRLAQELLQQKELPQDSRAAQILPLARERAAFFAEMCGGIQFVYDRWLGTLFLTDWAKAPADRRTVIHLSTGEQPPILSPEALDALRAAVQHATPDAPQGALDLPFPYRGTETPCTLHFRVLWPQGSSQYSAVIGLVRPAEA